VLDRFLTGAVLSEDRFLTLDIAAQRKGQAGAALTEDRFLTGAALSEDRFLTGAALNEGRFLTLDIAAQRKGQAGAVLSEDRFLTGAALTEDRFLTGAVLKRALRRADGNRPRTGGMPGDAPLENHILALPCDADRPIVAAWRGVGRRRESWLRIRGRRVRNSPSLSGGQRRRPAKECHA
jgi:hypothetical protein